MSVRDDQGLSPETFWYADRTYGAAASARQIEETLGITDAIEDVPENGTVLNLGAGIYLAVNALIQLRRPDIRLISVDSGYRLEPPVSEIDGSEPDTLLSEKFRGTLTNDTRWRRQSIAALAERLPLADETFDLIFSHAAIPDNMYPGKENFEAVLGEVARVLKLGGTAILGPFLERNTGPAWQESVDALVVTGLVQEGLTFDKTISVSEWDRAIHAKVTELTK